jgi:peptidoglycan/LPS O-acetylase OafA/YrhL
MPTDTPENPVQRFASANRILWIDILRTLCAFEIVGFHWLRAGSKTGAFAAQTPQNLILNYRQLDIGIHGALHSLNVAPSAPPINRMLVDGLGAVFGFGWEAVFVFVLLSGTSLSLSLAGRPRPVSWLTWIGHRQKRILIPFYLIAGIVSGLMFTALAVTASRSSFAIQEIHNKIAFNIGPDISGIAWSQLLLIDPHTRFWSPVFLAPAWWFVPAILLAYVMFPFYLWLLRRVGRSRFLAIGAVISIFSYEVTVHDHVQDFSWWFIVLNECFNFFLGIVLGCYLSTAQGMERMELALQSRGLIFAAVSVFLAGNLCNLYLITYPISSLLFTGSLTLCGAAFARWISKWDISQLFIRIDSYVLYLLHQPIAFPLIVLSQLAFGRNAILAGLPVFFAITIFFTMLLSKVFDSLFGKPARVPANSSFSANQEIRPGL